MRVFLSTFMAFVLGACASTQRSGDQPQGGEHLRAWAYIEAPYDEVWRSFTEPEAYEAWFSSPCTAFGGSPGDLVEWGQDGRVFYRGKVIYLDYGSGLAFTWNFVGFGFEEPETVVEVKIIERGETVLVQLDHDCTRAPRTSEIISPVGWLKSLSRLKTLLETGEAMAWPEG